MRRESVIRHLIFDMDGTLADTAKASVLACERERAAFSLPKLEPEQVKRAIGIANPYFYEALYPDYPVPLVHAYGEKVEIAEEALVHELGEELLFPGVLKMLQRLKEMGVPMYIASTGSKEHVDAVLGATGITHFFTEIRCNEPEKTAMVGRLLAGRDSRDWAMVGDRSKDWQAAKNNGVLSVGAAFGYCDEQERDGFDLIVETPDDVVDLVSRP